MRALAFSLVLLSLVVLACRSRKPESVVIDPELAKLVSHDAVMVAGVRLEAVRSTPPYQRWVARERSADLDRFAKETGLDLRKDLSELLVASDGNETILMARGRFSASELESRLARPGVKKIPYKGHTLVGNEKAAVVFLNSSTAVAGPATALEAVIDRRASRDGGIPESLLAKVRSIPVESQVWAVNLGMNPVVNRVIPESGNLANLRRVFASLESATISVDLRSGLKMDANGVCRTDQDAKLIHDAMRGLVGMGRLSTPDDEPELLRFYDAIQIQREQNAVHVTADIPTDILDKFLERMSRWGRT